MRTSSPGASAAPVVCVVDPKRHLRSFLCDEIGGLGFVTRACADAGELATLLDSGPDVVVSRVSDGARAAIDVLTLLHARSFKGDILLVGADETMEQAQSCGRQLSLTMLTPLGTPYRAMDLHDRLHKFLASRPQRSARTRAADTVNVADALRGERFDLVYYGKIDARRLEMRGTEAALVLRPSAQATGGRLFRPARHEPSELSDLSAFALKRSVEDICSSVDDRGRDAFTLNVPVLGAPDRRVVELADALVADHSAMPTLLLQMRARDLVAHLPELSRILGAIRRSTIGISLDDFEASRLPRGLFEEVPVVEIKVDRSSLPDHAEDRRKHARCSRVLDLARRHGLRTVATGIDDPQAFARARDAGFDLVQGPLFGAPVARDKLARSLLPRQVGGT
ncbi:MAG: EAL domain-containing protein [Pseudomonadota bacterium]